MEPTPCPKCKNPPAYTLENEGKHTYRCCGKEAWSQLSQSHAAESWGLALSGRCPVCKGALKLIDGSNQCQNCLDALRKGKSS